MLVRFLTCNPRDLYRRAGETEESRYAMIEALIRELDPHILAIQELPGHSDERALAGIRRLAEATGLRYVMRGYHGQPIHTVARGNHDDLALGLLWREGIEPVPGSWRVATTGFWHALAGATFRVDGVPIDHWCYHAPPPVGRSAEIVIAERIAEAHKVATIISRAGRTPYGVIGADWNALGADFVGQRYYDPEPEGYLTSVASLALDRRPGAVLRDKGLVDAAAALQSPWEATTGHWPAEEYGSRRIDIVRVTDTMVPALRWCRVIDTPDARRLSDHLWVEVRYDSEALAP
jgi:hypothetical protein